MNDNPPGWLPREQYLETLPKATAYACLYFTDEAGRPLQLRASYTRTETWQNPGGNMDPGETPWQTAVRETFEETGMRVTGEPTPLLVTHYRTARTDSRYATVGFVFDGGTLRAEQLETLVLDPAEHTAWAVHDLSGWSALMTEAAHARLLACHTARTTGLGQYLEIREP